MKFLDPDDALKQFGLYGAQDVADVGSGAGHFALAAARRLDGGRLYAVDIEKEMLARLVAEAKHGGHKNLHPVWGDAARIRGIPLGDETIDRVLATNVLFQIDDRDAFAQEVKRMLRSGGKVLLIDSKHELSDGTQNNFGPHKHHRVSEDEAFGIFSRHGFKKEKNIDAGDYHYGMILMKL